MNRKIFESVYKMSEGTSNFGTPDGPFPLVACMSERYFCRCPKCDGFINEGNELEDGYYCDDCGETITKDYFKKNSERDYDSEQSDYNYFKEQFDEKLDEISTFFYDVKLESGYYEGGWVNIKDEGRSIRENYSGYNDVDDLIDMLNDYKDAVDDDTYNTVMGIYNNAKEEDDTDDDIIFMIEDKTNKTLDEIIEGIDEKAKEKEETVISEFLEKLCNECGFTKLGVSARFSNGETWYSKID